MWSEDNQVPRMSVEYEDNGLKKTAYMNLRVQQPKSLCCQSVDDMKQSGRTHISVTDSNTEKTHIILENWRITIFKKAKNN